MRKIKAQFTAKKILKDKIKEIKYNSKKVRRTRLDSTLVNMQNL
jgi:hypothetical protein